MNAIVSVAATLALLLALGTALGLADRRNFAPRWLTVAALLVLVNDALLTPVYRLVPDLLPAADFTWQGKAMALAATLAIAALPAFGWARCGLTLRQRPGSLRVALPVVLAYGAFFAALALLFPNDEVTGEALAFQLTMPGLEEEAFFRGLLLLALDQAFRGRVRLFGVAWGWGAVISCWLFGMVHAFGYGSGGFSFDPASMVMTALPSFVGVWVRYRTGSLVLPVLMHNFGNVAFLLI